MKKSGIIIIYLILFTGLLQFSANAQLAKKTELTSDNQLLGLGTEYTIKSKILPEDRPIIVSLPENYYEDSTATFPVLYLLDGMQNIKHVVGTVNHMSATGLISPMIIVGIVSIDRSRDFTPSNAGQNVYGGTGTAGIPQSGGAPVFLKFLEKELFPYVESNYRTHPYRILEGHSLGGLFCTYALMEKPELFDAFIIQAPALWWNKEEMTQKGKGFFKSHTELNKTVYFGIGGGDGWGMRQELLHYVNVVKENKPKNFRWMHEEVGDEDHDASRLLLNYYGLKFIFSDLSIPEKYYTNYNNMEFLEGEQALIKKYGPDAKRPPADYFNLAGKLLDNKNTAGAITVFNRASEVYPMYVSIWNELAKLYKKTNQTGKAIACYDTAIKYSIKYKLGLEEGFRKEIENLKQDKKSVKKG